MAKLSDMRIVNGELENLVFEPRKEFITMQVLVIGNIPLLYWLNQDWYDVLMHTPLGQALLAAKAGATYVSPFVGRLDDISEDGVALVAHIVKVYRTYGYKTQVLAASIRHTQHIIQCLDAGADVATCPLAAIEGLLRHPLTDSGLEKFLTDHARLNT